MPPPIIPLRKAERDKGKAGNLPRWSQPDHPVSAALFIVLPLQRCRRLQDASAVGSITSAAGVVLPVSGCYLTSTPAAIAAASAIASSR